MAYTVRIQLIIWLWHFYYERNRKWCHAYDPRKCPRKILMVLTFSLHIRWVLPHWFLMVQIFSKCIYCFQVWSGKFKGGLSLQWRHNGHDGVSNHQPLDCLRNYLFRRWSKKTSKLHVTGLCGGIHRWPVNSPHIRPITRKMFPFDDVIMISFSNYKILYSRTLRSSLIYI